MEMKLKAQERIKSTKGYLKQNRKKGIIAGICYGSSNVNIFVNLSEFKKVFRKSAYHIIIELDIEGDKKRKVLIKDYEIEPVSKEVVHIDFLEIFNTKKVKVKIPIRLLGQPEGLRLGGILEHKLHSLVVKTLPKNIPNVIDVKVEKLNIEDSIYVENLNLGKDVVIFTNKRQVIATVSSSRTTRMSSLVEDKEKTVEKVESKKVESKKVESKKVESKK